MIDSGSIQLIEMRLIVDHRWERGDYLEQGVTLPNIPEAQLGEPMPYESYMVARAVGKLIPGRVGKLVVEFPPNIAESNELHTHPSDRIVTILEGSGVFVAQRDNNFVRHFLQPGDRIYMPRWIVHTFWAYCEGIKAFCEHGPYRDIKNDPEAYQPWGPIPESLK